MALCRWSGVPTMTASMPGRASSSPASLMMAALPPVRPCARAARPEYASQSATISRAGICCAASMSCCARAPAPMTPSVTRSPAGIGRDARAGAVVTAAAALVRTVCFMKSRRFMGGSSGGWMRSVRAGPRTRSVYYPPKLPRVSSCVCHVCSAALGRVPSNVCLSGTGRMPRPSRCSPAPDEVLSLLRCRALGGALAWIRDLPNVRHDDGRGALPARGAQEGVR